MNEEEKPIKIDSSVDGKGNEINEKELKKLNDSLTILIDYFVPTEEEEASALKKLKETPKEETIIGRLEIINDDLSLLVEQDKEKETKSIIEEDTTISQLSLLNKNISYLVESSEIVEGASSSILTYSVFYIPLIIIVISLWWFFKQFLTRFF